MITTSMGVTQTSLLGTIPGARRYQCKRRRKNNNASNGGIFLVMQHYGVQHSSSVQRQNIARYFRLNSQEARWRGVHVCARARVSTRMIDNQHRPYGPADTGRTNRPTTLKNVSAVNYRRTGEKRVNEPRNKFGLLMLFVCVCVWAHVPKGILLARMDGRRGSTWPCGQIDETARDKILLWSQPTRFQDNYSNQRWSFCERTAPVRTHGFTSRKLRGSVSPKCYHAPPAAHKGSAAHVPTRYVMSADRSRKSLGPIIPPALQDQSRGGKSTRGSRTPEESTSPPGVTRRTAVFGNSPHRGESVVNSARVGLERQICESHFSWPAEQTERRGHGGTGLRNRVGGRVGAQRRAPPARPSRLSPTSAVPPLSVPPPTHARLGGVVWFNVGPRRAAASFAF